MVKEAIILAGGLGTRLREAVPDVPKCLAMVAGRPFLFFVINHLRMQGIERFVFSVGYKWEAIDAYLCEHFTTLDYELSRENEPLGTGGAIRLALGAIKEENVLVANGDTLFKVNVARLSEVHETNSAECTLALKPMTNFDRYGVVDTDSDGRITSFREKRFYSSGLINGGVYLLNRKTISQRSFPEKFSFEKDYLEKYHQEGQFFGSIQQGYFIDIGIPSDYHKAQQDLSPGALDLKKVDRTWTLFIDRDGVINDEKVGEYVLDWNGFRFSEGVLASFKKLSDVFGRVIVVSNQRGVGKGLMTVDTLETIHRQMKQEIEHHGGRIDNIYYCTEKDERCIYRKPNPGMAAQALNDFPGIDPARSVMVGNKPSDMQFGRFAGMYTVFVRTTNPGQEYPHPDVDLIFPSLAQFAAAL